LPKRVVEGPSDREEGDSEVSFVLSRGRSSGGRDDAGSFRSCPECSVKRIYLNLDMVEVSMLNGHMAAT
jgi:hypothetical protein